MKMTQLERYNTVRRIVRATVKGYRADEYRPNSKVYYVRVAYKGSGSYYALGMWNVKCNKVVIVDCRDVEITEMSIEPIHTIR
jgi:hypothetical protein